MDGKLEKGLVGRKELRTKSHTQPPDMLYIRDAIARARHYFGYAVQKRNPPPSVKWSRPVCVSRGRISRFEVRAASLFYVGFSPSLSGGAARRHRVLFRRRGRGRSEGDKGPIGEAMEEAVGQADQEADEGGWVLPHGTAPNRFVSSVICGAEGQPAIILPFSRSRLPRNLPILRPWAMTTLKR